MKVLDNISLCIEEKFNIKVMNILPIGEGYDSKSYLIDGEYLFKFAKHNDARNSYKREKRILDYLKDNFNSNVKIPRIEYYDESGIMGYKIIKGTFLTKDIYESMDEDKRKKLVSDIAQFLKSLHNLEISSLSEFENSLIDSYQSDLELLRKKIFSKLTIKEQTYIENTITDILNDKDLFNVRKCLCHNDLSANHILLDDNNELCGIIDFGDACIIEDYCDFMYLLEDSNEEVGTSFGESILDKYNYEHKELARRYANICEYYYPIELIVCGIENDDDKLLEKGLSLLKEKIN